MTPDERLDQLEPLLSEALTVLDRHTAQLKQHSVILNQHTNLLNQLVTAVGQQSDSISFLLREQAAMKADLSAVKTDQGVMNKKLDLILEKLSS